MSRNERARRLALAPVGKAPTSRKGERDVPFEPAVQAPGFGVLDRFFELSRDLLCVADFDGFFLQLSPSWGQLLGYTTEELTATPFEEFIHPEDRERTAALFEDQVSRGLSAIRFQNRYRHKDGSYRTLSWNATPDPEAGLVYAVAQCLDPQIEAERAILASEELFRSAFDDALAGMCLTGVDGRFQRVNAVLARMLGRTPTELVGIRFADVTHPDDRARNTGFVREALAGGVAGFQDEKRLVRPDGTIVWVRFATILLRDAENQPSHFVTQMIDSTREREAANERDATAAMLDGIVQNSQSLVYVKDLDGRYLLANEAFLTAFAVTEQDLIGRDDTWLDPNLAPVWRANDLRARQGAYRLQEWSDAEDGRKWYESVKFPLHDATGDLYGTCGVSLEVTELHNQREDARRAEEFSSAVLAASPDTIVIDDLEAGRVVYVSRTADAVIGTRPGAEVAAGTDAGVHPDDRIRLAAALVASGDLQGHQVLQIRYRGVDDDGGHRWLSRRLTPFKRDAEGHVTEVLSVVRDVTEVVAAEDGLKYAALHDPLTGLPNRTLLADRLAGALARAQRSRRDVAVLFCDLDGFKRVNDVAGHAVGDAVLSHTARRLKEVLRGQDTVARVGGDEFVIVLEPGEGLEGDARDFGLNIARRVVSALNEPVVVDGVEHDISISVGVAFAGGGFGTAPTAEDVLRDADAAMYQAKYRGKDRFEVFEKELWTDVAERGRIEAIIRCAVRPPEADADPRLVAGRLAVAYQPIYAAGTRLLEGFEALARLTDSYGVPIPPDVFIAIAEDSGLIRQLGQQVLRQACRQLARWRQDHMGEHLTMAVNLSPRQAQHPALVDEVMSVLAEEGLPPDRLVLELTESVLLDAGPSTISAFRALRTAGVGISIDDFGTGYASLRYLVKLPVSEVKVDRSFTAGLPEDPVSATIVRAVAGLARDLSLRCVVEGVETAAQLDVLPSNVSVQGFLLGRPAAAEHNDALIRAGHLPPVLVEVSPL